MALPRLTQVSTTEETLLYAKLNEYNRGRASYKQAGAYLIVLPYDGHPMYSLWVFDPDLPRRKILFIHDLTTDTQDAFRMASTMLYYSERMLLVTEYHPKQMQTRGDDLICQGKYHGHDLYEILKIDPAYLSWFAYKYTPRIPKQERFVQIAKAYYKVHLDLMKRHAQMQATQTGYLGNAGETIGNLTLKVEHVRTEDNPYKTCVYDNRPQYFVIQNVSLSDMNGHNVTMRIYSKRPSAESRTVPSMEHAFHVGEIVHIDSARIKECYEYYGKKYTRLYYVKFKTFAQGKDSA